MEIENYTGRMKNLRIFVFSFIAVMSNSCAASEQTLFTIDRSEVVNFKSSLLDRHYKLYIQPPRTFNDNPKKRYPVIFLNDGNYSFPLASSVSRQLVGSGKIEDLLIVGISYSDEVSWQISRTRDYTPTYAPKETNYHSPEAREYSGGAGAYLEFIDKEVMPYLGENYRADLTRKIYAGHSFGGLFGGYIIKTAPTTFNYYVISDPSFWYDSGSIFRLKQQGSTDSSAEVNVLIMASNPNPALKDSGPLKMWENAQLFAEELCSNTELNVNVRNMVFDNEIHESLFPISLTRGLRDYLGTNENVKNVGAKPIKICK